MAVLDRWAMRVRAETERHLYRFHNAPAEFKHSEAYYRVLMLIVVLQEDFGVHYNAQRISDPDFTNSQDLFIHGMIPSAAEAPGANRAEVEAATNGGTCVSMPVLYVAIGRRLGYPLKLAVTKGHVFARWEDEKERFNIEATHRGLSTPSDEEYKTWPHRLAEAEVANGWYLKSLTADEELGLFLLQRGYCLEANGRLQEAIEAYSQATRMAPKSPEARESLILAQHHSTEALSSEAETHAPSSVTNDHWLAARRREAEEYARRAANTQAPHSENTGPTKRPNIPGGGT